MGLFSWLRGARSKSSGLRRERHLEGSGDFDFEVVGESNYQEALSSICGGHCEEGHNHRCSAQLVPESNNPYDKNAVAVVIRRAKVAYLSRDDAQDYRDFLASEGLAGRTLSCDAVIVGGWLRQGGRSKKGSFGVKLDLDDPFSLR